jgi:hypothetical protein
MTLNYSDINLTVKSPLSRNERRRLLRAMDKEIVTDSGARVSFLKQGTGWYAVGIEIEHLPAYETLCRDADGPTFERTINRMRGHAAYFAVRRLMTRISRTFGYELN